MCNQINKKEIPNQKRSKKTPLKDKKVQEFIISK